MQVNCEVKLDKNKAIDKVYFDKKLKRFTQEVKKCGILEEVRLRRTFMKPSVKRKLSKQLSSLKWKYYS